MPSLKSNSRPGLGRPTRETVEKRRQHILEIALGEFVQRGYEGASIEGVAQAAGTGKPTLYRHFGGKKGLFIAVIEHFVDGYVQQLSGYTDSAAPAEITLRSMGRFISDNFFQPKNLAMLRTLIGEMPRVPDLKEIAARLADTARAPVLHYLAELEASGVAEFGDVRRAAIQFINLSVLGHHYFLCDESNGTPDEATRYAIVDSAVGMLLSTYAKPGRP